MRIVIFLLSLAFLAPLISSAQCTVASSNGYSVNISICPTDVIVSTTDCPWGYNYNIRFTYSISFSGTNIPSQLYTLQTEIDCNGQNNGYYNLPLSGGSGSAVTVTNPAISYTGSAYSYGSNPSCTQANLQNLHCTSLNVIIQGPGISSQTVNCNCAALVLPVSFLAMSVQSAEEDTYLRWEIESEENNDFYTLEKSLNGQNWTLLSQVKSLGDTQANRVYETEIPSDSPVDWYVKLSQTDKNGRRNELAIATVPASKDAVTFYPNPAGENGINVHLENIKKSLEYTVRVLSVQGQEVFRQSVSFADGDEWVELPERQGFYFVEVSSAEEVLSLRKVQKL